MWPIPLILERFQGNALNSHNERRGCQMIYLRGLAGGALALLLALLIVFFWINREPGIGFDPVSYLRHYSLVPRFWIVVCLVFGAGFYVSARWRLPQS